MRTRSLLFAALLCAVSYGHTSTVSDRSKAQGDLVGSKNRARREADPKFPPFPCDDFQDCVQKVHDLKLVKEMCERQVAFPRRLPDTSDNLRPCKNFHECVQKFHYLKLDIEECELKLTAPPRCSAIRKNAST